jgi:hypothetical protein
VLFRPGRILRFRGTFGVVDCELAAVELQGRCKRISPRELMITQPVEFKPQSYVKIAIANEGEEAPDRGQL